MASIKPEKGLRPMNVKRIIRRVTDNDYLFTIFTKILAVLIGLVASFYSNRFLGPQLKGELGRISSLLSIVAVTANFGLYQPYPYYKRRAGCAQQVPAHLFAAIHRLYGDRRDRRGLLSFL